MSIKKVAILICTIAMASVYADYETLNLFGSIGVGFGMGGQESLNGNRFQSSETNDGNTTVKDHFFNYGNGMKFNLGCQYFIMEDLALQPSFSYSAGIPIFKTVTSTSAIGSDINITEKQKFHLFGIKVQLVPRFELLDLIDMYTGVGFGFFWNSRRFEIKSEIDNAGGLVTTEAEGKISSKPTFGFTGMLGGDYPLNDRLTLFGELAFEQVRFNLKKFTVSKSSIPTLSTGTTYYSKNDNNSDNLDPEKVPGSSFQIRVGVRFALN